MKVEYDGRIFEGSALDILAGIKLRSPFTKDMPDEEYVRFVCGNLKRYSGLEVQPTPEAVLEGLIVTGSVALLEE